MAMAAVAAATAARFTLTPVLDEKSPFLLNTIAILACSWYGGRAAGYIATLLAITAGTYLFTYPQYTFFIPARDELARLLVFIATGFTISWFVGRTRGLTLNLHQKEQELSRAHERLSQVLETTTDAVYTVDRDWVFTYLNANAKDQLARGRELLGMNLWDAFPDLEDSEFGRDFRHAMNEGVPTQATAFYPALHSWFEVRAYPSHSGLSVYFRNVTARKRAEDALRESEQRFRTLIEQASDAIFITDDSGRFTEVNGAACNLLGNSRSEILRRKVFDVIPPEDHDRLRMSKKEIMQGRDLIAEWRLIRRDGSVVPVEASVRMMADGRLQAFARDITHRKHAEEALLASEKRFRSTFENAAVGIAHVALDGRWLRVNQRLCEVLGYTREELLELTFQDVTHPADLVGDLAEFARLKRGEIQTYRREKRYRHKQGHTVWASLTVAAERHATGAPIYCISVIQDITDRKRTEQELQTANDDLRQFAYAASHDLQEPLRMITSFSQLLARRYEDSIDEVGHQYIHYAVEGARRLESLLHNLRAYWRASEYEFEQPAAVAVRSVVNQAMANLGTLIRQNNAVITCDELPVVIVEPTALLQVFQNLISNAVKYRHPDRAPRIHVTGELVVGEWLFSVRDNGIGIPEEYRTHVFTLFKRLHGFDQSGSGIGLALCQKVVERRGGRIWVESNEEGATFRFTLPTRPRPALSSAPHGNEIGSAAR
jgi:PAS domain S-box-containing protein